MPVTKSVIKKVRQNEKRRAVNRARKTTLKTAVSKTVAAKTAQKAKLYPEVQSVIDKTSRKGVIHRNKASRIKSRLAKQVK